MIRILLLAVALLSSRQAWTAGEPLLAWRVASPTSELYLLGSVHVAFEDIYPLREEIETAFSQSSTLVVEVDIGGDGALEIQQLLLERGALPPGESLEQSLSPATWEALLKYLRSRALPPEVFVGLKPALVATTLSNIRLAELGMHSELGIDQHFLNQARGSKNIVELETAQEQVSLLLDFPQPDLLMVQTLTQLDEIDSFIRPIYDAWRLGDSEKLNSLLLEDERQQHPEFELIYQRMFDDRNGRMTSRIVEMLATQGSYFVVVGAGHLVGETGIIAQLEQRGYQTARF
ncbi:MAG: TraB/GumN family protein [Halioglobus sp.]